MNSPVLPKEEPAYLGNVGLVINIEDDCHKTDVNGFPWQAINEMARSFLMKGLQSDAMGIMKMPGNFLSLHPGAGPTYCRRISF